MAEGYHQPATKCCATVNIVRLLFLVLNNALLLAGSAAITFSIWSYRKQQFFTVWRDSFSYWMTLQFIVIGCVILLAGIMGLICLCKKSRAQIIGYLVLICISIPLTFSLLVINVLASQETETVNQTGEIFYETRSQQNFFISMRILCIVLLLLETVAVVLSPILMRSTVNTVPTYAGTQVHYTSAATTSDL